ncbi:hypothetical protein A0H81_04308 [Grifola frondosa]|uniref:Uncharacterized protein n=1 Tax=Grifola frondosa TaxID=5627 RepID=A0A1C7MLD7_GRIFR|nr:hypothetical protein A0H81_04308 [Grifola frondosa]
MDRRSSHEAIVGFPSHSDDRFTSDKLGHLELERREHSFNELSSESYLYPIPSSDSLRANHYYTPWRPLFFHAPLILSSEYSLVASPTTSLKQIHAQLCQGKKGCQHLYDGN